MRASPNGTKATRHASGFARREGGRCGAGVICLPRPLLGVRTEHGSEAGSSLGFGDRQRCGWRQWRSVFPLRQALPNAQRFVGWLSVGPPKADPFAHFERTFGLRKSEADAFYSALQDKVEDEDLRRIQRQAFAGILWSKQFFYYDITEWLDGDPAEPKPPGARHDGRNREWVHATMEDVVSMPDKWEFPWFAAWDWAFHLVTLASLDLEDAKRQLILLGQAWYMHPNGQLPAYEWNFSDVNPPVQAWAALRIYDDERRRTPKVLRHVGEHAQRARIGTEAGEFGEMCCGLRRRAFRRGRLQQR